MPFIDDDLLWCPDNDGRMVDLSCLTAAQSVQPTAVPPLSQGGEFSDLTELSHADLNGLVSEIEGEDEIFKQFGNFELDNIFAEFDEKVGDCTTLLNNHTEADDFLRKRLAKRNYLDDHRENSHFCSNGVVSSSNQVQCSSSVSNDDCHSLQLGGNVEGTTISVRGSITLSSGRYLPSMNANHQVNLPLSYGEPSTPPCSSSTYISLSSATPTLSSLLNTPSLHNQSLNMLKSVNTSSPSTPVSSRTTSSHCLNSPLPSLIKNKNIVAANPLLAEKLAAPAAPLPPTSCAALAQSLGIGPIKEEPPSSPRSMSPFSMLTSSLNVDCDNLQPALPSPDSSKAKGLIKPIEQSFVVKKDHRAGPRSRGTKATKFVCVL
ncbi:hypothetical protein GHT06_017186 [Daphnia sinensis]|uniref:Uncharacterized protein n=1 Tax=Daphnia sinensis TaxID=1820382 RepID=A0AAD5KPJ1_9CRUS|nr:hypothetical protein GHT06_017186 [Daphnia sinensis]